MRVKLLGPFEVQGDDGVPIEIPGAKLRTLLGRLALEPGRIVSFDALATAIWGDEPPAGSANALQSLVSRTRRLVGATTIESHPAGYLLAVEPHDVDVALFERLVAIGDLTALREAERLWRGPALVDLPFADGLAVRLADLRLTAGETRLALELAEGNEVLAELRPLAEAHPLRERLQRLLIQALYAAGRQAEALDAFERTRRTLADELGVDPSPELTELHLSILRQEPPRRTRRSNLRAQVTSFVGRDEEIARLAGLLGISRLVTVVGPGGAGKTRLAAEVAERSEELAPDGVWLVELASVTDQQDVARAVLTAIGARSESAPGHLDAAGRLAEALGDRRALLVLDNCEHLVSAVAELADRLLGACPQLRILATSRESLAIGGEHLYPLPPLSRQAAVELFAERAKAVRPGFLLDDATAKTVAEICRRLDGMPLAIELAAARMRALSVEQIATKLDDRFRLLSSGSRTAMPRHRTLLAVVDWSWGLLSDEERELAPVLAAFPGGATLEALEAVSELDVLDALTGLVDKSLVEPLGERYRMQETVRSYGMRRLVETGQDRTIRARHAAYYAGLAESADARLRTAGQLPWIAVLRAEHDNILAALRFAAEERAAELGMRLVTAMWWFWHLEGRYSDALHWSRDVIDLPGEAGAGRLVVQGLAHLERGDVEAAGPAINAGIELEDIASSGGLLMFVLIAPALLGDQAASVRTAERVLPALTGWDRAMTLTLLSSLAESEGDMPAAFSMLEEARRGLEPLGERWAMASTSRLLAEHHARRGDLSASIAAHLEALRLTRELGVPEDEASILGRVAVMHARTGELGLAQTFARTAMEQLPHLQPHVDSAFILLAVAEVALWAGDRPAASRELDAAERMNRSPQLRALSGCLRATAAVLDGDARSARQLADGAIDLAATAMDMPTLAAALHVRAAVDVLDDRPEQAAHLLGVATAVRGVADLSGFDQLVRPAERARAQLGDERYTAAYERGAALTRESALALARQHLTSS